MAATTKAAQEELQLLLSRSNTGTIRPEEVIEFARDPKTALHAEFEWDNSAAAHEYRLSQARTIIRAWVIVLPRSSGQQRVQVKMLQSLSNNRGKDGGYQRVDVVMRNKAQRYRLLLDTIARLDSISEVALFPELDRVAKAIAAARSEYPEPRIARRVTGGKTRKRIAA